MLFLCQAASHIHASHVAAALVIDGEGGSENGLKWGHISLSIAPLLSASRTFSRTRIATRPAADTNPKRERDRICENRLVTTQFSTDRLSVRPVPRFGLTVHGHGSINQPIKYIFVYLCISLVCGVSFTHSPLSAHFRL